MHHLFQSVFFCEGLQVLYLLEPYPAGSVDHDDMRTCNVHSLLLKSLDPEKGMRHVPQ